MLTGCMRRKRLLMGRQEPEEWMKQEKEEKTRVAYISDIRQYIQYITCVPSTLSMGSYCH